MKGVFLFFLFAFFSSTVYARSSTWDSKKGNCENVFKNFKSYDLNTMKQCLFLWESYKPTDEITEQDREMLRPFLYYLYTFGDEEAQYYSKLSMARMKIVPKKLKKVTKKPVAKVKKKKKFRKKYDPPEVSDAKMKKGNALVKKGLRYHKKGKYKKALKFYLKALKYYPRSERALYNAACAYSMLGDKANAIEFLRRLVDLNTKLARKYIKKARTDKDFYPIRDDIEFKEVTGYAKIKICNGVGEAGEEPIGILKDNLEKLGFPVETVTADKHPRSYPIVWFKPYEKATAYFIYKVINHPKTKFQLITWDSDYDIIISWGDIIQKNQYGEPIVKTYWPNDPEQSDKKLNELLMEEDKMLRDKEQYARKVDKIVSSPETVGNKVKSSIDRVDKSIKVFEKTGKKIEKLFK